MHSDDSPLPCHMAGAVSLKSGDGLAMLMGSGSSPHLKKVLGGVLLDRLESCLFCCRIASA